MRARMWTAGMAALAIGGLTAAAATPAYADIPQADLAVEATSASGTVPESVDLTVAVTNHGPDAADPALTVYAPHPTVAFSVEGDLAHDDCYAPPDGELGVWAEVTELQCLFSGELASGDSFEVIFSFLLEGAPVYDGYVEVSNQHECCADPDVDNNLALLVIDAIDESDLVSDLAISATEATGEVGDAVDVDITVTNHGPDTGAPGFTVTAPSGTAVVGVETNLSPGIGGCIDPTLEGEAQHNWTEATELECSWESALEAGLSLSMTFSLRIDSSDVGDDGLTIVTDLSDNDPDLSNNSAPIVITVVGGGAAAEEDTTAMKELAVTGAQAGLVAAAGLALLVVGGALFVLTRRRRALADDIK